MRKVVFEDESYSEFVEWSVGGDKTIYRRLVRLIEECRRTPFEGIGKPEPLKGDLSGYWSRRITDEHRLVYKVTEESVVVIACKYHYAKFN